MFKALADPSRRRILDLLRNRPLSTGALAREFEFSRFAVMKHLEILVSAGLVIVERRGRERLNHLNVVPLQHIHERWMRPFEAQWAERLTRLKTQLERSERED